MDACRDLQSRPIKLLTNYDFWDDPLDGAGGLKYPTNT